MVRGGVEDDTTSPDGFELLHYQGMGQETLRGRTNGNLYSRDPRDTLLLWLAGAESVDAWSLWSCAGWRHALQRIKVVAEGVNQFARGIFFEQAHGDEFCQHGPRFAHSRIAWICLGLFLELQTVGDQRAECSSVEVIASYLRLDWLDKELRHLWGPHLVPGQSGLAFSDD